MDSQTSHQTMAQPTSTVEPSRFYPDPGEVIGGRTLRTRANITKAFKFEDEEPVIHSRPKRQNLAQSKRSANKSAAKPKSKPSYDGPRRELPSRNARLNQKSWKELSDSEDSDEDDFDEKSEGEYDFSFSSQESPARKSRNPVKKLHEPKFKKDGKQSQTEFRYELSTEVARRQNIFFLKHRELIEPLLGERNYISKLPQSADEHSEDMIPYKKLEAQPDGICATMKPYQLAGLSFLIWLNANGLSGILGDEMGLGKTLQTLALFQHLTQTQPPKPGYPHRPFLVVCPLSVLTNWVSECKKFTPGLRAMRLHGPGKERDRLKRLAESGLEMNREGYEVPVHPDNQARGWDIIVTSYETFVAEKVFFRRQLWRYVVLDEGHAIKNSQTNAAQALLSIGAEYRLILTGTPLQNNLLELWSLFHWLYPNLFTDKTGEEWKSSFDLTKGKVDTAFMTGARKLLELVMLRRMKTSAGVDLGLPPKEEIFLYVPLTPVQRLWYKTIITQLDQATLNELFVDSKDQASADIKELKDNDEEQLDLKMDSEGNQIIDNIDDQEWVKAEEAAKKNLQQVAGSGDAKWRKLMNLMMQLRKICNHPYLIPGVEPDPYYIGQHIILASGKFILLDKLVKELVIKQGRKVLMFSNFTKTLDICEEFLGFIGGNGDKFKYLRLDGSTARGRRNLSIRLFNKPDSEYKVFLISTKAGGLGINLTSASEVIMLDANWNPQADLQAEARSHRIGQKNKVTVYRLITQGTVEEQMLGRIQKKLYLSAKVTESMRDVHNTANLSTTKATMRNKSAEDDEAPQLSTNQLMGLIRRGAQAIARPEIDAKEMISWDWDTM